LNTIFKVFWWRYNTYQITATIQGGNSGGPLFDDKGNFIGITPLSLGQMLLTM